MKVIFDSEGGYIEDKNSGEATRCARENDVYHLDVQAPKHSDIMKTSGVISLPVATGPWLARFNSSEVTTPTRYSKVRFLALGFVELLKASANCEALLTRDSFYVASVMMTVGSVLANTQQSQRCVPFGPKGFPACMVSTIQLVLSDFAPNRLSLLP